MPTVEALDLGDLVATTLKDLGRFKVEQIAQTYQRYEVFPKWFKKDKMVIGSGHAIQRNLMNKHSSAARHVGLMDVDNVNIADVITQLTVPWRQCQTSWAIIYQETLMNRSPAKILDLIKVRRTDAMLSLIEELENTAWAAPSAATDETQPYGIPYWVVKATAATPSFQGGSAFSDGVVAGVNLTTTPNYKNWAGQYVSKTKADLVKKMRDMHWYTGFVSPVTMADYRGSMGDQYRVYCNRSTTSAFEEIGESQNENLGRDIASIDGFSLAFRGNPIRTIAKLEADTSDPVYFIDHSTFYPTCLEGDSFRESKKEAPHQHNIVQMFVDLSYNYVCVDRRRNGVLHVA